MKIDIPHHLSDLELEAQLRSLARGEQEATARLIAHLAEFDARRLYLPAGFSSLFAYCCEVLRLSEPAAYNRIEVARAARRFPEILAMLGDGLLSLATARLIGAQLTAENRRQLLAEAAGKSKREVEQLLVSYCPRPDVATFIRKLPAPRTPSDAPAVVSPAGEAVTAQSAATLPRATAPSRPAVVAPLAPERYEIRFTAGAETRDKLRRAQDLLRHAIPTGDLAEVIDRALTLLLEDLARKKFAATDRPRARIRVAPGRRDVPASVQRAVWLRDGGRCTFVGTSGRRCAESAFVEFDHVHPYGMGGDAAVANIRLLCRAHNGFESERLYGHGRPVETSTLPGKSSAAPP